MSTEETLNEVVVHLRAIRSHLDNIFFDGCSKGVYNEQGFECKCKQGEVCHICDPVYPSVLKGE